MTTETTETAPAATGEREYELVAKVFDKALSKPGEPFVFKRYREGDKVPLSESEAARLLAAGAVVEPGSREAAAAAAAFAHAQALLAQVPENLRAQLIESLGDGGAQAEQSTPPQSPADGQSGAAPAAPAATPAPRKTAPKEDWVAYAVQHKGADQADAEKLDRAELIARYGS